MTLEVMKKRRIVLLIEIPIFLFLAAYAHLNQHVAVFLICSLLILLSLIEVFVIMYVEYRIKKEPHQ